MDSTARHEYEQQARMTREPRAWARLDALDQTAIDAFDRSFQGALRTIAQRGEELAHSGHLTRDGVRAALQPEVQRVQPTIERFEQDAADRIEGLEATRARIERGELVRGADGTFTAVMRPEATPVSEARAAEIRAYARTLSPAERQQFAVRALQVGDAETLHALEGAPAAMALLDARTQQMLAALRFEASGWSGTYQQLVESAHVRQRFAAKARRVLEGALAVGAA